jgi:hypothetical protein
MVLLHLRQAQGTFSLGNKLKHLLQLFWADGYAMQSLLHKHSNVMHGMLGHLAPQLSAMPPAVQC